MICREPLDGGFAMRDPVIVAPDEKRPDEWKVGDSFFFAIANTPKNILVFTVVELDKPGVGLVTSHSDNIDHANRFTNVKPRAAVEAYLARVAKNIEDRLNAPDTDAIWKAVMDFGKN
jgi:hypothetical protein